MGFVIFKNRRKQKKSSPMGFDLLDIPASAVKTVSSTASAALNAFGDITGTKQAISTFTDQKKISDLAANAAKSAINVNKNLASSSWSQTEAIRAEIEKMKAATGGLVSDTIKSETGVYKELLELRNVRSFSDLQDVGKGALAAELKVLDPGQRIAIADRFMNRMPIVSTVYDEIDVYSGGLVQRGVSAAVMPGKLARGNVGLGLTDERVSKAEFIMNMIFYAQVAAIALSGGSAASVIGFTSQQLKQGPIGETETGRTILDVGAVAGVAATGGAGSVAQNLQVAAENEAKRRVSQKAAEETAKRTGTGELGQIAVGSALAPGSFQENLTEAGKQKASETAVIEVSRRTGTTGGLLTSVSLAALERSAGSKEGMTPAEAFQAEAQARAISEAQKRAISIGEAEAAKRVGAGEARFLTSAAEIAASENMSEAAKNKAYSQIIAASEKEQNKLLNEQQRDILAAGKATDPTERERLINKIAASEVKIYDVQRERNSALKQAGLSPQYKQDELTQNALNMNMKVLNTPDPQIPEAKRKAFAEKHKNVSGEALAKRNQKMVSDAEKARLAGDSMKALIEIIVELQDLAEAEDDPNKKALLQAEAIKRQDELFKKKTELNMLEDDIIKQHYDNKVFEVKSGVMVAAYEEGRLWPGYEYAHPMLKYGLIKKR